MSIYGALKLMASGGQKADAVRNEAANDSLNNWESSLSRWEKVSSLNKNDVNAKVQIILSHYNLGRVEKSNTLMQELVKSHPEQEFVKMASARHATRVEDYGLAKSKWEQIVVDNIGGVEPLINLANIAIADGDLETAFSLSEKIFNAEAGNHQAYLVRGRIFHRTEKWQDSKEAWLEFIEHNKNHFEAELHLCTALLKLEEYDELFVRTAKAIENLDFFVPFMILNLRAFAARGENKQGVTEANKILAIDARNSSAIHAKAHAAYRLGDYSLAEQACNDGIAINENDVPMLTLYAKIAQTKAQYIQR